MFICDYGCADPKRDDKTGNQLQDRNLPQHIFQLKGQPGLRWIGLFLSVVEGIFFQFGIIWGKISEPHDL